MGAMGTMAPAAWRPHRDGRRHDLGSTSYDTKLDTVTSRLGIRSRRAAGFSRVAGFLDKGGRSYGMSSGRTRCLSGAHRHQFRRTVVNWQMDVRHIRYGREQRRTQLQRQCSPARCALASNQRPLPADSLPCRHGRVIRARLAPACRHSSAMGGDRITAVTPGLADRKH